MNTNDLNNSFSSNAFKVDFADETLRNKLWSSLEWDEIWEAKKNRNHIIFCSLKENFPRREETLLEPEEGKENIYRFKKKYRLNI